MLLNPMHATDGYKLGHRLQYPPGTTKVVSNLTARSAKNGNTIYRDRVVFFGLRYFIDDFLHARFTRDFFARPKAEVVAEYSKRVGLYLGQTPTNDVAHIAALHDLQYLPICIRALPEGTAVPIGVPMMTIENTLPEFYWLTNYFETVLSSYLWLPCTSATTARCYRALFDKYAELTGVDSGFVDYQGHDFSFRGMSSLESAMMSGAAHMLYFRGTDSIPAIDWAQQYYDASNLIGCSVPATEHSVMSMGGMEDELGTFTRLITDVYPTGIVSIVSDTWDFWRVMTEYLPALKNIIMAREGKAVIRPDSGDPYKIICGDIAAPEGTPQRKGAVQVLWELFGGTFTTKHFRQLDPHIGLIYGDSITPTLAERIMSTLYEHGFASNNVVLGIGSYTYQYVTRDTWGFAVKATYGEVNGEPRDIFKKPATDDGTKVSLVGLPFVYEKDGWLRVEDRVPWDRFTSPDNLLSEVWCGGYVVRPDDFETIRQRARGIT